MMSQVSPTQEERVVCLITDQGSLTMLLRYFLNNITHHNNRNGVLAGEYQFSAIRAKGLIFRVFHAINT